MPAPRQPRPLTCRCSGALFLLAVVSGCASTPAPSTEEGAPSKATASGPSSSDPARGEGPDASSDGASDSAGDAAVRPFAGASAEETAALIERVREAAKAHFEEHPYSQVWVAVDKSALAHNAAQVKEHLGERDLCAVVKGDAYGHGLEIAAPAFAPHADAFCLTENAEAEALRALGLEERLVRIRLASPDEVRRALVADLELEEFVGSLAMARAFDRTVAEHDPDGRLPVHIVLDSGGMGRNGFPMGEKREESLAQLAEVAALPHLSVVAITAHLPGADAVDLEPTLRKARQFLEDAQAVHEVVAQEGHEPIWHLSNSAASARLPDDIQAKLHMDRVGGTLYGMQTYAGQDLSPWKEPMTVLTHVAAVHRRSEGDTVGYGSTARIPEDGFAAANVGVGWLNLPRQLSGRGFVLDESGQPHAMLGKLSMNTIVVAAESEEGETLTLGDPVLLLSPLGPTVADAAQRIGQPPSYVTLAVARENAARFAY